MSKIKLSEKYGINPCISVCCWCGEKKNEIALLGKLKDDVEAPMHAVLDYEPCEKCLKKFKLGVVLIEVIDIQPDDKRAPIKNEQGKPYYPTLRYSVIKTEEAKRIFNNDKLTDGSQLLLEEKLYEMFITIYQPKIFLTCEETICHNKRDFWNLSCALDIDISQGNDLSNILKGESK